MFDDKEMQAWELKPSADKTWDSTKTHFVTLYKSKEKFNAKREASSTPAALALPPLEPCPQMTTKPSSSTPTVSKLHSSTLKSMPPLYTGPPPQATGNPTTRTPYPNHQIHGAPHSPTKHPHTRHHHWRPTMHSTPQHPKHNRQESPILQLLQEKQRLP
eukprot:CCRYP_010270-RA/>CCRYP_010270-RA protein AED:0.82 eAED:0.45 QI:0/-1/0/1/-1/1/1/0/158